MFLFSLTYVKPLSEVERLLPEHIRFLDEHYEKRRFLCSGRKAPRTGGVILCSCRDREDAKAIMEKDPFYREGVAEYELIEFIPSKYTEGFGRALSDLEPV